MFILSLAKNLIFTFLASKLFPPNVKVIRHTYTFHQLNFAGNPYLLAFSMRRNWARLTAPSGGAEDPRLDRLKLFHGLRAITMICVIFSHTSLIMSFSFVENPAYIEKVSVSNVFRCRLVSILIKLVSLFQQNNNTFPEV